MKVKRGAVRHRNVNLTYVRTHRPKDRICAGNSESSAKFCIIQYSFATQRDLQIVPYNGESFGWLQAELQQNLRPILGSQWLTSIAAAAAAAAATTTTVSGYSSLQALYSVRMLLYIACRTFSFLAPPECLFSMISFHGVLHCKLV